jgi:hypothetical protein
MDLRQLGASIPPSQDLTGSQPTCEVASSSGGVTIGFQKHGLSDLVVEGPVTDVRIGGHPAKKMSYSSDSTGCLVAIGVTGSSRIDLSAEVNGGVDPCSWALKAAGLVERHLPVVG